MTDALARLDAAAHYLATATTVEDVERLHDRAVAIEQLARAERMGADIQRYAYEIRLKAARKAGQLLAEMRQNGERQVSGGNRRSSSLGATMKPPTLHELGIKKDRAARWLRIATLEDEAFMVALAEHKGERAMAELSTELRGATVGPRNKDAPAVKLVKPGPKAKVNGWTEQQSLRGLQNAAIQLQALAELFDGNLVGDWSRVYLHPEAQRSFEELEESLPIVAARVRRALKEWKGELHDHDAAGA